MKMPKTEKTKAYIIATTAQIFNKKGFAGTSITDLTTATKLTSGSIYGNFANKQEVALAAFDYNLKAFRSVLTKSASQVDNPKEKLLMYLRPFHSSAGSAFPAGGCPMLNALTDADDTCEPLRRKAAEGILRWRDDLIKIIEDGKAVGEFKSNTDSTSIALHLIALCEFGIQMFSATQSHNVSDTIIETALSVAEGIMTNH